ncbi:hypothetical protein C1645_805422 [Glomus cerebriforme]|uniref:Uncharacterized protein n=1 Tax=Glomus cerebriforme TaxID=658196 RepID=A0A397T487_9GLOM|nr:hypothetical protein C1645_805422 [Glomus cerebriforme]
MSSSTRYFNKNFLPENHDNDSLREYDNDFRKLIESFPNFFHSPQERTTTNTLEYSKENFLISDENIKDQDNQFVSSLNNNVPCIINQLNVRKSTKEIESKVIPILERKLQELSIQKENKISDEPYKISKHPIITELDHLSEIKLGNNNEQKIEHASFTQELTFDSLPNDAFITIKQSKPIHNIALFISFNYDLSKYFLQEYNAHGFHVLFHDIQDHINIAPIVKLVTDVVVNCWTRNWNIIVFITSEPIIPISAVTALLKALRVRFCRKILEMVVIWPNAYEISRSWIDEQCRTAKATACIQGIKVSDIIPQIMSYFNNDDRNKEVNGRTTLFDEKKFTTCYHEFNISYPAAMEINDKIWLDAKQYFNAMKREMEKTSLIEMNSQNRNVLLESILRKALYNKFSQHSQLKHTLFSTRFASIYFTRETCQCNLYEYELRKNIVDGNPNIEESFINLLEEVRDESKIMVHFIYIFYYWFLFNCFKFNPFYDILLWQVKYEPTSPESKLGRKSLKWKFNYTSEYDFPDFFTSDEYK